MLKKIFKEKKQILMLIFILMLLLTEFSFSASQQENKSYFSIGSGYGIPYGMVGINCEVTPIFPEKAEKIQEYFGISIGLGYCPAGIAYAFGFRLYPLGKRKMFQPRVSFYHGVVGTLDYYGDTEALKGLILGGGLLFKPGKKYSLDFEAIYLLHLFGWDFEDIGSRFKISFGARLHL